MLQELREKHPRFVYESFESKERNDKLQVRFQFLLEPNVVFSPEVILPSNQSLDKKELDNFVFHLGLVEMISYWKTACSPEIFVNAGQLTNQQITWWHDLFINGLGEFFYHNKIQQVQISFILLQMIQRNLTNHSKNRHLLLVILSFLVEGRTQL